MNRIQEIEATLVGAEGMTDVLVSAADLRWLLDQNRALRAALLSLVNSQETDLGTYAEFVLATAQAALAGKELPG